ncbi:MAG: dihydrolipoamide acetyltransferase family protein [Parachlamydiales bacterium]|jgi:2-oxoglutarate dehydrogenase E2 component (dihydrolipoamide succinyltransferase)
MEDFEIKLPKLGESIVSATIVSIYKKENDFIKKDETLMEVSTDKLNSEIPSPVEGRIVKILVEVDQSVQVGDVIAVIRSEKQEPIHQTKSEEKTEQSNKESKKGFLSPAVVNFAKEKNINIEDLNNIQGTGDGGRVTRKDVENYINSLSLKQDSALLSPTRRAIAHAMTKSLQVPHAYLIDEIDVTSLNELIKEKKQDFFDKYNCKLTITSFIAKAIAIATSKYPLVNSSFHDNKLLLNKEINLGIAVNVNQDVIVPVIKNILELPLSDVSKQMSLLAQRARENKLTKEDVANGTITLTNFGMANVKIGLPIIKFPQASIVAIGAIKKKLAVLEDDTTSIRSILNLSLGFDHRVYDGIYGCQFINEIKNYLEKDYDRTF